MVELLNITEEEYLRWYNPHQVLDMLPKGWSYDTAVRTIANSLGDGLLVAVAETIVVGGKSENYFVMPASTWRGWACLADPDFWSAGTREHHADSPRYRAPNVAAFRAYRIRLDPIGVAKLVPPDALPMRTVISTATLALEAPPNQSGRGRPKWAHWDELWA